MSKPEDELQPYSLQALCAADRAAGISHIRVNVAKESKGQVVPSVERLTRKVEKLLTTKSKLVSTSTKLYIVGAWVTKESDAELSLNEQALNDAKEWKDGVNKVRKLIRAMRGLKELVWISGLPFMPSVFSDLPKLSTLVLDLGKHVRVVDDSIDVTKVHISPVDMMPLAKQTRLRELRLFGPRDSLQYIAWTTVYKSKLSGGMQILELQMDAMPIIRDDNNKWHKAVDVRGLTVAQPGVLEKPYKGRDGKGGLHWSFGYGEYLDGDCIRRARIASGVEEPSPLPLQCLKLDGFVIDHLPFEHELRDIAMLVCGKKCIDAGMRAPKTQAEPYYAWSKKVNNAACRFILQWPNWTGIFDTEGDQRDSSGNIVAQGAGVSTPFIEHPPTPPHFLSLTEETLVMKNISDGTEAPSRLDYFNMLPTSKAAIPLGLVSNLSGRGSEVPPPPPPTRSTTSTMEVPGMDGSITSEGTSPTVDAYNFHANGGSPEVSPTSPTSPTSPSYNSSFGSDGFIRGHKSKRSLTDSYWVTGPS